MQNINLLTECHQPPGNKIKNQLTFRNISEKYISNIFDLFKVGQEIEVIVLSCDESKIKLSLKKKQKRKRVKYKNGLLEEYIDEKKEFEVLQVKTNENLEEKQ